MIDIIRELQDFEINVDVYDPWADKAEAKEEYDIDLISEDSMNSKNYNGVVFAVAHNEFTEDSLRSLNGTPLIYDVKSKLPRELTNARL